MIWDDEWFGCCAEVDLFYAILAVPEVATRQQINLKHELPDCGSKRL
jgi:hypothetical protein